MSEKSTGWPGRPGAIGGVSEEWAVSPKKLIPFAIVVACLVAAQFAGPDVVAGVVRRSSTDPWRTSPPGKWHYPGINAVAQLRAQAASSPCWRSRLCSSHLRDQSLPFATPDQRLPGKQHPASWRPWLTSTGAGGGFPGSARPHRVRRARTWAVSTEAGAGDLAGVQAVAAPPTATAKTYYLDSVNWLRLSTPGPARRAAWRSVTERPRRPSSPAIACSCDAATPSAALSAFRKAERRHSHLHRSLWRREA